MAIQSSRTYNLDSMSFLNLSLSFLLTFSLAQSFLPRPCDSYVRTNDHFYFFLSNLGKNLVPKQTDEGKENETVEGEIVSLQKEQMSSHLEISSNRHEVF